MKNKNIGQRIKYFRKRSGLSQMELELEINAAFGSICRMERGSTNPSKETLFAISDALSLSAFETAWLFGIEIEESVTNSNLIDSQFDSIYSI